MRRRRFLHLVAAGSAAMLAPSAAWAEILTNGREVAFECLGDKPGLRWLDGRTASRTVGLVDRVRIKTYSGTKWRIYNNHDGTVGLQCRGVVDGPRWLDGRTANGTVGLAPNRTPPFSGTRWQVVEFDGDVVALKCLGSIEGNRWLDGRTVTGSVGLAPNTDPPFTGARWRVSSYPVCIDQSCD